MFVSFAVRRSKMVLALFLTLALAPAIQAQWAVLSVRSVDQVVSDAKYVLRMAGKEDLIDRLDGTVATYLGKGIDRTRPFGIYLSGFGDEPPAVALIPFTTEAEFADFLKGLNLEVSAGEKGLRSVDLPFNKKLFFRFDKKYIFAADREELLKGELPEPTELLSGAGKNNLIAFSMRIDQLPAEAKQKLIASMQQDIQRNSAKRATETAAEHEARVFGMRLVVGLAQQIVAEAKELAFSFNVDQPRHSLNADFALSGKSGSKLAEQIRAFGSARSAFGGITGDSALYLVASLPIPPELRKELDALIDKIVQEALGREQVPMNKTIGEKVFRTLEPTLKSDALDLALMMKGPAPDQKYTFIGALKVKEGLKIEALVKEMIQQMPEAERKRIKLILDHDKVGGIGIHSFMPTKSDARVQEVFGSQEVFFAFRNDALLFALGSHGDAQLKHCLETLAANRETGATTGLQAELAVSRIAMVAGDEQNARFQAAIKQAFKAPGQDRIRISIQGGDGLHLRVEVSAYMLKFFVVMTGLTG